MYIHIYVHIYTHTFWICIYIVGYKIKCVCMLYLLKNNHLKKVNSVFPNFILNVTYGQCLLNQCMELVMHLPVKLCQCGPWNSISFRVFLHGMFLKNAHLFSFRANPAEEWQVTDHHLKWSLRIISPAETKQSMNL